ncbi:cystathionine beta-synthase (beta-thionase) [Pseudohyphozyma bogoriensis]|nr:cystathionine beta-synthase (beta-thionase) [Pseudohyphozyma bogoriensis]
MVTTDYRGAVVEDLQRDFSILPISHPQTRLLQGWVAIALLKDLLSANSDPSLNEDSPLSDLKGAAIHKFVTSRKYQVITPDTALEELEEFFKDNVPKGVEFALVTDQARKFVLGLVTKEDLEKFITRRTPNLASTSLPTA